MTEANDPGRVLRLVFDNAVQHRNQMIKNVERAVSDLVRDAVALKETAQKVDAQAKPFKHDMTALTASYAALQRDCNRLISADIHIQNLEGLIRTPDFRFFGNKEKGDVAPAPIKSVTAPETTGSKAETGKNARATNPGLQRQRERKKSSDDK